MTGRIRRVPVAVSLALALIAAACGGDDEGATATDTYTIGWSVYSGQLPFYQATLDGFRDFTNENGWELLTADANFDVAAQVGQVTDMVTRGVDMLIIAAGDQQAMVSAYRDAEDAGIPIISYMNDVAEEAHDSRLAFFHVDWVDNAEERVHRIVEISGETGNVAAIRGPAGIQVMDEFTEGFEQAIGEYPDLKVVSTLNAPDFTSQEGARLMQDALTSNPEIDVIWSDTDLLTLGIIQALKEAGRTADDAVIGSAEGILPAMELMQEGWIDSNYIASGYAWALQTLEAAKKFLETGEAPPADVLLEVVWVTQDNAAELQAKCSETPAEVNCRES